LLFPEPSGFCRVSEGLHPGAKARNRQ